MQQRINRFSNWFLNIFEIMSMYENDIQNKIFMIINFSIAIV